MYIYIYIYIYIYVCIYIRIYICIYIYRESELMVNRFENIIGFNGN